MTGKIEIECRVQYKRSDEWFTLDEAGEALIVIEGELVELLERWEAWFVARQFHHGSCGSCLLYVEEQGHASDCLYAMTEKVLNEWYKEGSDEDD